MKDQREMLWRDERIVQVDYNEQPFTKADAYGFTIKQAFVVRDGMDEPSLPISQQWFWSPREAIVAIEMVHSIAPDIIGPKLPSTKLHEYNQMTLYWRNFDLVYHTIVLIKKALRQNREFDENPTTDIESLLNLLHQNVHQRRPPL